MDDVLSFIGETVGEITGVYLLWAASLGRLDYRHKDVSSLGQNLLAVLGVAFWMFIYFLIERYSHVLL